MFVSADDAFINCSYLSEKWAANALQFMKGRYSARWNAIYEQQYQDELRHSKMLLGALEKNSPFIIHDIRFSIQERLFERGAKCAFIDLYYLDFDQFLSMQYIMEKRAIVSYKVYQKHGTNEHYKKVLSQIILDEKGHFRDEEIKPESEVYKNVKAADHWLFHTYSVKGFAPVPLLNDRYWEFYYKG